MKKLSKNELADIVLAADRVMPVASVLRHIKSGNTYHVVYIALRESDLQPMIVYRPMDANTSFVRPLYEMTQRFEFVTRPGITPTTKDMHKT